MAGPPGGFKRRDIVRTTKICRKKYNSQRRAGVGEPLMLSQPCPVRDFYLDSQIHPCLLRTHLYLWQLPYSPVSSHILNHYTTINPLLLNHLQDRVVQLPLFLLHPSLSHCTNGWPDSIPDFAQLLLLSVGGSLNLTQIQNMVCSSPWASSQACLTKVAHLDSLVPHTTLVPLAVQRG